MFWQRALGTHCPGAPCRRLRATQRASLQPEPGRGRAPRPAPLGLLQPGLPPSLPAPAAAERQRPPRPARLAGGRRPRRPRGSRSAAPLPPGPSAATGAAPAPQARARGGSRALGLCPPGTPCRSARRPPRPSALCESGAAAAAAAPPGPGRAGHRRTGPRRTGPRRAGPRALRAGGGVTASQPRLCMSK